MAHLFDREVGNRASWSFDSRKLFFPSFFFKENQQFRLHIFLRFRYIPVPYFSFSSFILCVSQRTSTLYRYCKLFVVAEIMNLFVLVLVVLLLHFFLDSQFLSFGPEFFRYYLGTENDLPNPAVRYVIIVHCG